MPSDDGLVVDYEAVSDVIQDMFQPIAKRSGELGNLKGHQFEAQVADHLRTNARTSSVLWESFQIAKGTADERDVDVGVVHEDTLFIVECKAFALGPEYDKGDPRALTNRYFQLDAALRQADSLADFLARNPSGSNWQLPSEIRFVVGVTVTPHTEFIEERTPHYFLEERCPRVCTASELSDVLGRFRSSDHRGAPWLCRVVDD